ncbi:MAG: spondin domain-containing protein [Pseudomonadota bacterium]
MKLLFKSRFTAPLVALLVLTACGGSSTPPAAPEPAPPPPPPPPVADATFEVSVTNLTLAQPLSPVAVMFHRAGFNSFIDGETSSLALELLAEGGDNTDVLGEVAAATEHLASGSTAGPVPPSAFSDVVTLSFPSDQLDDVRLSVITMLVHTNDAFSGMNATNISNMEVGQSITFTGPTWDAGTEANDELGVSMPGPDFGGEGFNPNRDDRLDLVRFHQGVVTSASVESGLASSSLVERHRFDNPTTRITVTRTE